MPRDDETCWTVIQGAAQGDAQARSQFAHTYLLVVRAYLGARWRGGSLLGKLDDAVQDVFLDCFRSEGALGRVDRERGTGFRTFLYGVVRKVAQRYEERAGRKGEAPAPSTFDPAEIDARDERLSILFDRAWAKTVLARAGERHRAWAGQDGEAGRRRLELLRLRFGEGLPIREIAARWQMDPALLHAEYRKAREEFKQALREEVAFHHPGTPLGIERECETLLGMFR